VLITTQQSPHDIFVVGGMLLLGSLSYVFYLRPRSATHWVMLEAAGTPDVPTDQAGRPPAEPVTRQPLVAGSSSE
jgi:hypothetical protein